ncbi:hypothetical protein NBRC111894_1956 [Sporolactobacillus inulinus]|uniref:Uncharacterized protein n=1 Tax=Sporolactobacillus inulinus TaxID=2078 RepID=A0A4Y1ZBE6_9BACL|nr:hypothetical protein NBRC111894_1956 [Sporolactobacillus inulinus]
MSQTDRLKYNEKHQEHFREKEIKKKISIGEMVKKLLLMQEE